MRLAIALAIVLFAGFSGLVFAQQGSTSGLTGSGFDKIAGQSCNIPHGTDLHVMIPFEKKPIVIKCRDGVLEVAAQPLKE